jgi:hypothetical protein
VVEERQSESKAKVEKQGRGWTERFTGPVRYRRFTKKDDGGRPSIFIKVEEPTDGSKMPEEVWDIIRSVKYLDRGPEHGGGEHHTGLSFTRSRKYGRAWRLPDTAIGRTAADIIDARLSEFAERLDREERGR